MLRLVSFQKDWTIHAFYSKLLAILGFYFRIEIQCFPPKVQSIRQFLKGPSH